MVNSHSLFESPALAENAVLLLKKGDHIQLERRGYYYVDQHEGESGTIRLHYIPDGKQNEVSVIEHNISAKEIAKGSDDAEKNKKIAEKKEQREKKNENKEKKKQEKGERKKSGADQETDKAKEKGERKHSGTEKEDHKDK